MLKKALAVLRSVKNWYWIPFDKMIGGKHVTYHFRGGLRVKCRTKETLNKEPIRAGEHRKFRDCLFVEQFIGQFYDFRLEIRAFQGFFTQFSVLRTQFARRAPSGAS